jgi:hypothetical protein
MVNPRRAPIKQTLAPGIPPVSSGLAPAAEFGLQNVCKSANYLMVTMR